MIRECITNQLFRISRSGPGSKVQVVHHDRLKPHEGDNPAVSFEETEEDEDWLEEQIGMEPDKDVSETDPVEPEDYIGPSQGEDQPVRTRSGRAVTIRRF